MNQNKEQEKETNLSNPTQENRILFKVYKDEGGLRKQFNHGRWTQEEHETFLRSINRNGIKNWKLLEKEIKTRSNCQIRSHFQKYLRRICSKYRLKRNEEEVFVHSNKNINPTDLELIDIFNNNTKVKRLFRKKKQMRRLKFNNKKKVKTISSETIRNGISNTSNLTINPNEEAQKNESSDISTTTTQINYDAVYYELLNLFTANAQIQCVLGNEFSDLEKILQSVQSLLANQSKF